ncbi:MAG: helix-turn-helix domain-containing protein [Candidatus Helarchaeota archaeon]
MAEEEFRSTKQVLEQIGLMEDEISAFFNMTGRGPVVIGEIALLTNVEEERAEQITKNLLQKGLIREIPGKTPHYMALPPYVALLSQLERFKSLVEDIQATTPKELEQRFKSIESESAKIQKLEDYIKFIQAMKSELPNRIKTQFKQFEEGLEQVKKLNEVRAFIRQLRDNVPSDITKEFTKMQSRLDNIKAEISRVFEKQFRIGALKTFAEKIVSRIISKEFQEMSDYFQKKFIQTTQHTLDQVIGQLSSISATAGEISTDLDTAFVNIDSGLKATLMDIETRVKDVHQDIQGAIDDLRMMFQREIFEKLQRDILTNIINQLDISKKTMSEFWERTKKASLLSFKDVWFVRSPEGMLAQINDSLSRVKMRLYIVAPKLANIDIMALSKVPPRINIRISTNFDERNPLDSQKIKQLKAHPNIQLRLYRRENLWAVNKDFEEIVLCVVSSTGTSDFEIAGMGSILEEHVKLFAGVLEEVWMGSRRM